MTPDTHFLPYSKEVSGLGLEPSLGVFTCKCAK